MKHIHFKQIIFVALAVFFSFSYGQKKISGIYTFSDEYKTFEKDYFIFEKNGSFKYIHNTCTGMSIGVGKYKITPSDSLKLNFQDLSDVLPQEELEFDFKPSDKLYIDIKTIDYETKAGLPYTQFIFTNTNIGCISDNEGYIKSSFLKSNIKNKLTIKNLGYKDFEITIPDKVSTITGNLIIYPNIYIISPKNNLSYKITDLKNSNFTLNRFKTSEIKYVKASRSEIIKILKFKTGKIVYSKYLKKIIV